MTSILDLPEELLIGIFELAVKIGGHTLQNSRIRTRLCLVSKDWNNIVQSTPSLWCRVSGYHPFRQNQHHLLRSQNHPLDIDFSFTHVPQQLALDSMQSFSSACDHIDRWRTASVFSFTHSNLIERLSPPAPLLERLEVRSYPHDVSGPVVNLFNGQARRLKSVTLLNTRIPWENGMLSGLHTLELSNIRRSLTVNHLLSFMSSSPLLRALELSALDLLPPDSPQYTVIHLRHLHTICLADIHHETVALLLQRMHAPSRQRLTFSCSFVGVLNPISFVELLGPFIPRTEVESGSIRLVLGVDSIFLSFAGPRTPTAVSINLTEVTPSILLGPFLSTLPPELRAVDAQIIIPESAHDDSVLPLLTTADSFLRVTKLGVHAAGNTVLGRLTARPWLFLALTQLELRMHDVRPGVLSRMIQARCWIHPFVAAKDLPLRLVKLVMYGDDEVRHAQDRKLAEAILGSAAVERSV